MSKLKSPEQILRSVKRFLKKKHEVDTLISIEKRYSQNDGWTIEFYEGE